MDGTVFLPGDSGGWAYDIFPGVGGGPPKTPFVLEWVVFYAKKKFLGCWLLSVHQDPFMSYSISGTALAVEGEARLGSVQLYQCMVYHCVVCTSECVVLALGLSRTPTWFHFDSALKTDYWKWLKVSFHVWCFLCTCFIANVALIKWLCGCYVSVWGACQTIIKILLQWSVCRPSAKATSVLPINMYRLNKNHHLTFGLLENTLIRVAENIENYPVGAWYVKIRNIQCMCSSGKLFSGSGRCNISRYLRWGGGLRIFWWNSPYSYHQYSTKLVLLVITPVL